jgi:Leucine-rich repeat (LRR) protein
MDGKSHTYTGTPPYTVTITGDNIREFSCSYNKSITTLDVSNCTALTKFLCYYNQLTNLNVRNCTALYDLDCRDNQLSTEAISNLFRMLNSSTLSYSKNAFISDNPGAIDMDYSGLSIARGNGWSVYFK